MINKKRLRYILLGAVMLAGIGFFVYSANDKPNSRVVSSEIWKVCVHPLFTLNYPNEWFVYEDWIGTGSITCDELTSVDNILLTSQGTEYSHELQEDSQALIVGLWTREMREAPPVETGFNIFADISSIKDLASRPFYFINESSSLERVLVEGEEMVLVFQPAFPASPTDQVAVVFHNDIAFLFQARNMHDDKFREMMKTLRFN